MTINTRTYPFFNLLCTKINEAKAKQIDYIELHTFDFHRLLYDLTDYNYNDSRKFLFIKDIAEFHWPTHHFHLVFGQGPNASENDVRLFFKDLN